MLLFLQFDIDESWALPFKPGSHLVVFMCPRCNDIHTFKNVANSNLPAEYWNSTEGHFFVAMSEPGAEETIQPHPPLLVAKRLRFEPATDDEDLSDNIRVGGEPSWLQDPEWYGCSCGSKLVFLSQIPGMFGFEKQVDAPEQPNSFSRNDYCLFLGNEIYIFACPKQCNPRSVWITLQAD